MTVNDRIRLRRIEIGKSVRSVAMALNVAPSTVKRYESNEIQNMGIDKIEELSRVLQCSPGYLMGWEDPPAAAPAADPLHKKIDRLDDVDKIRAEAYVDCLLSADKYQKKNTSAGTA